MVETIRYNLHSGTKFTFRRDRCELIGTAQTNSTQLHSMYGSANSSKKGANIQKKVLKRDIPWINTKGKHEEKFF